MGVEEDVAAADADRFIEVVTRVLALNYLAPDLRRRVVTLRRRMVEARDSRRRTRRLAPAEGLEPPTSGSEDRRSDPLS